MSTYDDATWEAWRSGRNPDAVDPDRISYDEAMGYEPEEIVSRELRRITPKPSPTTDLTGTAQALPLPAGTVVAAGSTLPEE